MSACDAAVFIDNSYEPYTSGRVRCRRALDHKDDHVATVMVRQRNGRPRLGADLTWTNTDEIQS